MFEFFKIYVYDLFGAILLNNIKFVMYKKFSIIGGLICLFGLVSIVMISSPIYYEYKDKREFKRMINYLPNYYRELAIKCNGNSCCLASVRRMVRGTFPPGGYKQADGNVCEYGYAMDSLKCEGSYKWCVGLVQ